MTFRTCLSVSKHSKIYVCMWLTVNAWKLACHARDAQCASFVICTVEF